MLRFLYFLCILNVSQLYAQKRGAQNEPSPIIFQGNEQTAYRDPAAIYHNGTYYLFFTLSETDMDQRVYMYLAMSTSKDLKKWSRVTKLTPKDQNFDYSSPGNIIRYKNEWIICLQTYPRPDYFANQMPRYGTSNSRLFTMRSKNLRKWSTPELLTVKGSKVPVEDMGRMIDPYLIEDKDVKGKYWCFYKQNGVSLSYSWNLTDWTYQGHTEAGENTCVLVIDDEYILFHSPTNGIGIKRSKDLVNWKDWGGLITLGQKEWPWARGRVTAGMVISGPESAPGKYLMFFHGSGPKTESQGDFDKNSSIGYAWSDDLIEWRWNGKRN